MTGTPRILVVDDEIRMCESVRILLGERNYRIETCPSARDAVAWLENNRCDLMLLDLMMPEMDGFDLLDFVKDRYPDVTVIMMTGHASIESAVEALRDCPYRFFVRSVLKLSQADELDAEADKRLQRTTSGPV